MAAPHRGASSVVMPVTRRRSRKAQQDSSLEDLLIPAIPSMISSLVLSGLSALSGVAKIGVGAGLGLVLWWLLQRRRGQSIPVPRVLRQHWLAELLTLVGISVVVLLVTVRYLGRPTLVTTVVSLAALAALSAAALTGRRPVGAAAAAVSGGVLGLCAGIAVG